MFTSAGLSFGNWDGLRRDNTEHDHIYNKFHNPSLLYPVTTSLIPLTHIHSNEPKCTHVHVQRHVQFHSTSHRRQKPLKPFHIKDVSPCKKLTREIQLCLMYPLRLLTYQLGSGNTTCTITISVNIKIWICVNRAPSYLSWIQMYNISFNLSV